MEEADVVPESEYEAFLMPSERAPVSKRAGLTRERVGRTVC